MEARIINGPRPSSMDAVVEANKRGYGKPKAAAFSEGVIIHNQFKGDLSRIGAMGARRRAWVEEGVKWAAEETARRATDPLVKDAAEVVAV